MRKILCVTLMPLCLMAASSVYAGMNAEFKDNIQSYVNEVPEVNSGTSLSQIKVFTTAARIWGKDKQFSVEGNSICFTEFMEQKIKQGTINLQGRKLGTCGSYMDQTFMGQTLVSFMNIEGAENNAGGDGQIIGGTGEYIGMTGNFNERTLLSI